MRLLMRWLVTSIALVVAVRLVPGIDVSGDAWAAVLVTAVVLGLVNATVKPVLTVLSCGAIVATLGLFFLVINGLCLWTASWISQEWLGLGFVVNGFWPAFWGGIVVSVVSAMLNIFVPDQREERESR